MGGSSLENNNEILELCVPEKILNPNNVSSYCYIHRLVKCISYCTGLIFKKRLHVAAWRFFFNTNMFAEMFADSKVSMYEYVLCTCEHQSVLAS